MPCGAAHPWAFPLGSLGAPRAGSASSAGGAGKNAATLVGTRADSAQGTHPWPRPRGSGTAG